MSRRRRRSPLSRRRLLLPLLLAAAGLALAFAAGVWFGSRRQPAPPAPEPGKVAERRRPPEPGPAPAPAAPPRPAAYPAAAGARVAILFDDLGRSLGEVEELEALGVPLAYAVLPFETRTAAVAAELRRRGAEVLCHLPMEPKNGANPGPGALTRAMDRKGLAEATRRALDAVPGAVGVNNHMGSGITADPARMRAILSVVADRGLFFVDSRTSPDSVGYRVALDLGVPAAERRVFLDVDPGPAAVAAQFSRLLDEARQRGAAIAIGHPYPTTLEVLARELPRARAAGYEFVPVSYLADRPGVLPR